MVCPPTVSRGGDVVFAAGFERGVVRPLTTRADAERVSDYVVPETVRAGPPGVRIWPAIT